VSYKDDCAKVARDEVTAMSDFLNGGDKAIPHRQYNALCGIFLASPSCCHKDKNKGVS
jgi:hypothetical protein